MMKKMKVLLVSVLLLPVALTVGLGLLVARGLNLVVSSSLATAPWAAPFSAPLSAPARGSEPPPAAMGWLYRAAAATCPGLSWTVLAAIGAVESDHGRANLPGVHSGRNAAGAEGPMQFEPATFAAFAQPVPPGGARPPSPYDPVDSVYAASRMLCADGASDPSRLEGAIYQYNHSQAYVAEVMSQAQAYLRGASGGAVAVDYALSEVGTPYRWGGESPGVGFDCSGLVQAAWAAAGITLPRVAQAQFDAGPMLPPGWPLAPGDLVFFGTGPDRVTHVGLVVDPRGVMVDAPHAGAEVRIEPFPLSVGASWGSERYLGSTAPDD
jgi:cell wall-associated NlpC family hydrolase